MERDFLVLRLAGPMAAWGDITVGERRSIWVEPSKSGVLGLVGSALGLAREDSAAHQALNDGLGFAGRIDRAGLPLRDYHTAQSPKARRNLTWRTRREELADRENLNTVLSERLYRLDSCATIALWRKADATVDLANLAAALRRPRFMPYLGRRACPLGEPAWARVVSADGLLAALAVYDDLRAKKDRDADAPVPVLHVETSAPVWFELGAGLDAEEAAHRISRQRRDGLRDRNLRHFADRREGRLNWASPPIADPLKDIVA